MSDPIIKIKAGDTVIWGVPDAVIASSFAGFVTSVRELRTGEKATIAGNTGNTAAVVFYDPRLEYEVECVIKGSAVPTKTRGDTFEVNSKAAIIDECEVMWANKEAAKFRVKATFWDFQAV